MKRAHASPFALALLLALPIGCKKSGESATPTEATDDDDDDDQGGGGGSSDDDAAEATLNHSTFEEAVGEHMGDVGECFNAAAEATPGLGGTLSLTFNIKGDGSVESTSVAEGSTLTDGNFVGCVQGKAAGWRFPKTPTGEPMMLTFPFKLKAS